MADETNGGELGAGKSSFDELLAKAKAQAEAMLADFMAQDPATIDIAGQVPHLPGMVFDALVKMKHQLSEESRAAIDEWQEKERQRARELWALMEQRHAQFVASLPPNWQSPGVDFPCLDELEVLQLKEGLPLAWVPPNPVLRKLLGANTPATRRKVIATESDAILAACLKELRRLKSDETKEWRASAREAAQAMKSGYWRAGQALAAIALDTAAEEFVRTSYSEATQHFSNGKPNPPGSSPRTLPTWHDVDYPRALLVLHSLFGAFRKYRGKNGEPIPAQFTRHGTVHSMGRRQYTKANALIALMHLVGLLCLIEDE